MATHIAFLRAINLGAKRRFPAADICRVANQAGFAHAETYLNTGNLKVTSSLRSSAKVAAALATAFEADRRFEVPTIAFTPDELAAIVAGIEAVRADVGSPVRWYTTLYAEAPSDAAAQAAMAEEFPGERLVVKGRAAHALIDAETGIHGSKLLASSSFRALGVGTSRTDKVLATLAAKWS